MDDAVSTAVSQLARLLRHSEELPTDRGVHRFVLIALRWFWPSGTPVQDAASRRPLVDAWPVEPLQFDALIDRGIFAAGSARSAA